MSELSVCASPADSPQWRKGPRCKPVLCNACGTRFLRTRSLGKVTSQTYIHAALVGCGSTVCHTAVICSFCAAFRAVFVPAYARSPATVKYCNLRYLVCAQHVRHRVYTGLMWDMAVCVMVQHLHTQQVALVHHLGRVQLLAPVCAIQYQAKAGVSSGDIAERV